VKGELIAEKEFTDLLRKKGKLRDDAATPRADGKVPDQGPVCIFVTFNQGSPFNQAELRGPCGIEGALTSRVAAWYTKKVWKGHLSEMIDCSLEDLIDEIRKREGQQRLIILAIDELRKISNPQKLTDLLNSVTGLSQQQNENFLPFLPVVSCVDVEGVFSVRSRSGRPLLPIPLLPCPIGDMEKILEESLPVWSGIDPAVVRHQFFSTNGHYRSLEVLADRKLITAGSAAAFPAQLAVLRHIYQDPSMRPAMTETEVLDPAWNSEGKSGTLYECACDWNSGIFYLDTFPEKRQVTPQLNMMIVSNSILDHGTKTPLQQLLLSIIDFMGRVNAIKSIEQVIPRLLVLRAFLREAPWRLEQLLSVAIPSHEDPKQSEDLRPGFIGWQPSDTVRLCTLQLKMEDLDAIDLAEAVSTEAAGDALMMDEARSPSSGVRFAFPKVPTYPGIEGVVFGLLCERQLQQQRSER
jgi:hypothetical protein